MNLYILRHGLAVEPGTPGYAKDADRPLTPKGERKLWQIAEAMEALELSFDLMLSSPYLRARQTADIIAEAFNARKKLEFSEFLTPSGSPKRLIEFLLDLKPLPGNVLLVGHKGGLCKLNAESLKPGRCAALEWLLTPGQMKLMGGRSE